jgi:hypothetical protein
VLSPGAERAERAESWRNQCRTVGYVMNCTALDVLSRMSASGNVRLNHLKLPT